MSSNTDPLLTTSRADRLHYSMGELLGADDFRAEQTYHRRQLARSLLYLYGRGTMAGLAVNVAHRPGVAGGPDEVDLTVAPGLAIDGAGRLVEVPRPAGIRLRRWMLSIAARPNDNVEFDAADLRTSWRADAGLAGGGAVVADVFLSFHACDRGYTPAFASGPFDALDASQPARVRDAYELSLILRREADANLPVAFDHYRGVTAANVRDRIMEAWAALTPPEIPPGVSPETAAVTPFHENPAGVDATAVLLARLRLPAAPAPGAATPDNPHRAPVGQFAAAAWANPALVLNNNVRRWVVPPAALARLAGV